MSQKHLPQEVTGLREWTFSWQSYELKLKGPCAPQLDGQLKFCRTFYDPRVRKWFPETQLKLFTTSGGWELSQIDLI